MEIQEKNLLSTLILVGLVILISVTSSASDETGRTQTTTPISSTEAPQEKHPPEAPPCFHADYELCTSNYTAHIKNRKRTQCQCIQHPTVPKSLVCCNITDLQKVLSCAGKPTKGSNTTIWTSVHIINATFREFDMSHNFWGLLQSVAVTDGNVTRVTNGFPRFSVTKCLNISTNNLTDIHPRAFANLTKLEYLDISHNNLSRVPSINVKTNLTVDIRKNPWLLCASVLDLIENSALKFIEPNATYCLTNQTFNWFNSTDSMPLNQLERMVQLNSECPSIPGYGNCTCGAEQLAYEEKDGAPHLVFTARVDCSGLGLTELPEKLPANTISLNVSNNNITSIAHHFHENPSYFNILRFAADNNQISSMYELEGTKFIDVFETFHLRRNSIDKVPEYLLSNALDNNPNGRVLYLGGNKLTCDCNSAKVLTIWLLARQNNIPDYDQILCRNMPKKVFELSEIKLCQSQHDWTDYIYFLIGAEVLLLIALILKVSYDYWVFKTSGYLPWPASKMPKLPCDWLCES